MIPGDIGRELAALIAAGVADGHLPGSAAGLSADGTWRPAPPGDGGGPGVYSSSLPFDLARVTGRDAGQLGSGFARPLRAIPWIASALVTGGGYLTATVTTGHLAGLAQRIIDADHPEDPPDPPDLTGCAGWRSAWLAFGEVVAGRLAEAAGWPAADSAATVPAVERDGTVGQAIAFYGGDAVRYVLARTASGDGGSIERGLNFPLDISNPFVAVRYAHADAASSLRWAADLGLPADPGAEAAAAPEPETAELRLLDRLSWFPERLGAAARQRRPAVLTGYLEALAADWLDCRERCPALPFGGAAAPADPALIAWRLRLADATRAVLAAGLRLLSVDAPGRI